MLTQESLLVLKIGRVYHHHCIKLLYLDIKMFIFLYYIYKLDKNNVKHLLIVLSIYLNKIVV